MTTETEINEIRKVITKIRDANSSKFKVLTNLEKEEHYVAGNFPSLILMDEKGNPVFIIEVKRNGLIAQCIQAWKAVTSIPATLYIIVPEDELPVARGVAQALGLQTRFGTFKPDEFGNVNVTFL